MGRLLKTLAAVTALMTVGVAQGALIERGGGMIYDTARNITWLADMNYAFSSGYAAANHGGSGTNKVVSDGRMGWDAARNWADNLFHGGFSDWRLPTLDPSDTSCSDYSYPGVGFPKYHYGYNCTGGELSGLFVTELGNKANESVLNQVGDMTEQIANLALFSNVQSYDYWSGAEYAPDPIDALHFGSNFGFQHRAHKDVVMYAVAVRPGDVLAVPEPATFALVSLALAGLGLSRRRQ